MVQAPRLLGMFGRIFWHCVRDEKEPMNVACRKALNGIAVHGGRDELVAFFEELLNGDYSDEDLNRIWKDAGSPLLFSKESGVRLFATEALEAFRAAE